MTLTEAKQYELQGWPHKHEFNEPIKDIKYNPLIPAIEMNKCRCGAIRIKRGDFVHISYIDGGVVV